jgi:Na+/H+ antiporter NhaC
MITGRIAREINDEYELNLKKMVAFIDFFSCLIQQILLYGAQVLLLLNFANGILNFIDLVGNT